MSRLTSLKLFAALMLPMAAQAAILTPSQALDRALSGSSARRAPSRTPSAYKLVYEARDAVYLFATGSGAFLATPADDRAPAVLGYSDAHDCQGSIPPAMKWWLGEYARQIKTAGVSAKAPVPRSSEREPIYPLLSTEWNQGYPYNEMCPIVSGQRAVTGCVATALAQVMKYHAWPAQGQGSNTYTSGSTPVSLDFSSINFSWDVMADTYAADGGDVVANDAVAELMYACGVSVDMQYGASESGAQPFAVAAAMVKYFDYDAAIRYVSRDFYTLADWEDYIYNQLVSYGPVQYSGQSNEGAHSFVCDGYSGDGYFHFNWGWGGMSDGYFLLTALDPGQQGIGGSTSGYDYNQSVIACVAKPQQGSVPYANLLMEGTLGIAEDTAAVGARITVTGETFNFSIGDVSGLLGLSIKDSQGAEVYAGATRVDSLRPLSGFGAYYVNLPDSLADGEYTLTPAFYTEAAGWQPVPVKISGPQQVYMTVKNSQATFSESPAPAIKVEELKLLSKIYQGQEFKLTAMLVNEGDDEFYGTIAPALADAEGTLVAVGENYSADVLGGESQAFDYVGAFNSFGTRGTPAAGSYTLYIIDASTRKPLSAGLSVEFGVSSAATEISVSDVAVRDAAYVDPHDIELTANVKCLAGYFGGSLTVAIFPYENTSGTVKSEASFESEPVFVAEGDTAALTAKGDFDAAVPGGRYMAVLYQGQTQLTQPIVFTIGGTTAAYAPGAETTPRLYPAVTDGMVSIYGHDVSCVNVYSASGALVKQIKGEVSEIDFAPLASGLYIVELNYSADGAQRHSINRVLRR